jgi:predicted RND superfamily exporter protein
MRAVFSGRACVAWFAVGDKLYSLHYEDMTRLVQRKPEEFQSVFGGARDLEWVDGLLSIDQIRETLAFAVDTTEALNLVLYLCDDRLTAKTLQTAAIEFDELVVYPDIAEALEQILFAHPLPKNVCLLAGIKESEITQSRATTAFLQRMLRFQPAVTAVQIAWRAIPSEQFQTDRDAAQSICIRHGVFRDLAVEFEHTGAVSNTVVRCTDNMALRGDLPNIAGLLGTWSRALVGVDHELPMRVASPVAADNSTDSLGNDRKTRTKHEDFYSGRWSITDFYRQYSRSILSVIALSFPLLWYFAEQLPSNNDLETWLPRHTAVREDYEEFKGDFGPDEIIVIGMSSSEVSTSVIEDVAADMDGLLGVRHCWTPTRMISQMRDFGLDDEEANRRVSGLLKSRTRDMIGIILVLSEMGIKNRERTVSDLRAVLNHHQLDQDRVALTGLPIITLELDRAGSQKANRRFFLIACVISLGLLYSTVGHWGLSLSLLGVTLWGIVLNQSLLFVCGVEMNFILGLVPILVMIFSMSISAYVVSHYFAAVRGGNPDPLAEAFVESLNPCLLSILTTILGLISLNVSTILPVIQFGYAAAAGSIIALIVGLGITPALLTIISFRTPDVVGFRVDFRRWVARVAHYRHSILACAALLGMVFSLGMLRLKPELNPVEFLPKHSRAYRDLVRVEDGLTTFESIEAVVYQDKALTFLDQLQQVREIEAKIAAHPNVHHTLSVATFLPIELPDTNIATLAESFGREIGLIADGRWRTDGRWRISVRIGRENGKSPPAILAELQQAVEDSAVRFTGMAALVAHTQSEILDGFWQSLTAAVVTISLVMLISLRHLVGGLAAMLPNLVPILLIFGGVGFLGKRVDIGMMMAGSITVGITVGNTFHFMAAYLYSLGRGNTPVQSCQYALEQTGEAMLISTLISALSMLALCMSAFAPIAGFGILIACQIVVSNLVMMVLMPAICSTKIFRKRKRVDGDSPSPLCEENERVPKDSDAHTSPRAVRSA